MTLHHKSVIQGTFRQLPNMANRNFNPSIKYNVGSMADFTVFVKSPGGGGFMVMGIYGDLFSPGSFIINPCLDLWVRSK